MQQINGKSGKVQTFEEFQAGRKRAAESDEARLAELSESQEAPPAPRKRQKRQALPKLPEQLSLADLLLQAVRLASTRKGRVPQAVLVREQTLLEVLQGALGRKEG